MKLLIMLLLIACLSSSCRTAIVCAEIESYKVPPVVAHDISFVFDRCRMRCLDVNKWEEIPVEQCPQLGDFATHPAAVYSLDEKGMSAIDMPIEFCEGVIGFSDEAVAKHIRPSVKALNQINKDNCN